MIAWMSVRHNWSDDGEADSLRLAKQRHEEKRGENRALQEDGNGQGAPLHPEFTSELFCSAVDQASTQRGKTFFGGYFGNSSGLGRHLTPPEFFSASFCRSGGPQNRITEKYAAPTSWGLL